CPSTAPGPRTLRELVWPDTAHLASPVNLQPRASGRIIAPSGRRADAEGPARREKMSYIKRFAVTGSVCPSTPVFGQRAAAEVVKLAPQFDRIVVAGIGSGVVASRIYRKCPKAVFVERSEEHTSELQSRENLVSRLL